MIQILTGSETTSLEFGSRGQYAAILLASHAGGTWTLQVKTPEDPAQWVDTNVTFTGDNMESFVAMPGVTYRLDGGTAGAVAWVYDNGEAFRG